MAEECARDLPSWLEHLPILFQGEQRKAYAFGLRLGQCLEDPGPFIDLALKVLAGLPKEKTNPRVLAAFLRGAKALNPDRVQRTLEAVAADEILCRYLVELTQLANPSLSDLECMLRLVLTGRIPITELKLFASGSVLDHLPPDDLIAFTNGLLMCGSMGAWTAFDILFMYQHGKPEHWEACQPQFHKLLMHPELNLVEQHEAIDLYSWQETASKLLEGKDPELALDLTQKILASCATDRSRLDFDDALQPVLRAMLECYRDTVWPLLSDALLSNDARAIDNLTGLLGSRFEENGEEPGVLFALPDDFLLEWCEACPTNAPPALARMMPLFRHQGDNWVWRSLARAIIDRYGEQRAVLSAIASYLGPPSMWGSLVPYYERLVYTLEQLRHHPIPEVRCWAIELLRYVQEEIECESIRDNNEYDGDLS
ncbi:MAG: hypothetical protein HY670_03055 [Chloroflexi bacterium]|nr:hypothetical protein [Chloroflexota bacterium]